MNNRSRILLDLKPTLDGYSGIPQESRLLFAGLRHLSDSFDVEGLLQHGASSLSADYCREEREELEVILRQAQTVLSFYTGGGKGIPAYLKKVLNQYIDLKKLRWLAFRDKPLPMGHFDSSLFGHFIWSRCFSKTLNATERELITKARYRILAQSRRRLQQVGIAGIGFGCKAKHLLLDTSGYDFFLAQTPFPGRIVPKTGLVIRYHDAMPVFMPHTTRNKSHDLDMHISALKDNVASGAFFSCISEATRNELLKLFPHVESRTSVIHNIVSDDYYISESPKEQAIKIIANRIYRDDDLQINTSQLTGTAEVEKNHDFNYLLMVSTVEPRKNHSTLLSAWERLKYTFAPELKLVLVGEKGWDYQELFQKFRPWAEQGELFNLTNVPSSELRVLYKHAAATICPSFAEGFDYSGIEAMRSGGVVAASDIAVHHEIYKDAAIYFDPYDIEDTSQAIRNIISDESLTLHEGKRKQGFNVSECYTASTILPKWEQFFKGLQRN